MTTQMLPAALELACAGLPVLPLQPRSKRPRFDGGYKVATLDATVIEAHWSRHRHDNIGVRPPAGVIVADVDPRDGGNVELARLVAAHGPLPQTWAAHTGSGGMHYWFTVGDVDRIRGKLCRGIDLKHGGTGFVVCPPSVHPDGGLYWWARSPRREQPALAPDWLRLAVRPPTPVVHTGTTTGAGAGGHGPFTANCLVARISTAHEGTRNVILYGALKDAQRQGDLDAFVPDLIAAAVAVGLDAREVEATLRSVRGGR